MKRINSLFDFATDIPCIAQNSIRNYVYMVITYSKSMDQPIKVAYSVRG